jgi:antitoxin VapB
MGLNIRNAEVERLAAEVAGMAHETKTEAIRRALLERRTRLQVHAGRHGKRPTLREYMERNVWPLIPPSELGRVLTREGEDRILGYGPSRPRTAD